MITRREFLKLCLSSAALSLSGILLPKVAEALDERGEKVTVIWLEMMTCTGDFLSFANTLNPDVEQLIKDTINLEFQNTMMAAEGELALQHLYDVASREEGRYILVAEGTVPTRDNGFYGITGYYEDGTPLKDIDAVKFLGKRAKHVIAIGTCASFGGPYAASPNPSGSVPVHKVLKGIQVINVPGCPAHPDWFVGTLSHVILYGVPSLDAFGRPRMFYRHTIHDFCPRRQHFENGIFAKEPGDEGCLFQIGCKGPVTYSDCPTRKWNSMHLNWPVGANTPCIGCVSPEFPDRMSPFFAHLQDVNLPNINVNASLIGKAAIGTAAAAIGTHAIVSAAKGRIFRHLAESSETKDVGKELEKVVEEKLSGDKISDEDMQGVEKSPSGSENKSVAKPENTAKHCEEISRELIPSRPKIKRPKKLVTRKLRR
ncbi:MAG: hydrogenase small subunit [Tepidanaerobacteraceae bacterium]|nr:hydrogenase small subunit [Tepidanaerobacter sp.]HQE05879.1 hydrogenase small subunit [Tepidanaerobacteraceae bacterium]